jgi:diguanylate cyclase (GGDEF)-like protein
MTVDIPTMYFVSVATNVAMTAAVMYVALSQSIPGLRELAWGLLANSGYYLVLGMHGSVPDVLSIGVGNMLGALTLTLCLLAVTRHRNASMPPALYVAPVLLMFMESLILLNERETRLIIASVILFLQLGGILWALIRPGQVIVGRGRSIMLAALVIAMATMAYRALALKVGWHQVSPFQSRDTLNTLFYMTNYLGMFFLAFGFVLSTVEQSAEKNRRFAFEDPLTGLPNRRAVLEALNQQSAQAVRAELPFSLLIMDLDYFKRVNDHYGHQAGDAVLHHVAAIIKKRLRAQDIAGRLGGEEFLVMLPNTPPEGALHIAEALRLALAAEPTFFHGQEIGITISIGLFGTDRLLSDQTPDKMIRTADAALYRAKHRGRDRVEFEPLRDGPSPGDTADAPQIVARR